MLENNVEVYESKDASDIAENNYIEYGISVNSTRALPSVFDGLKQGQRRIIFEANKLPDKLTKSTNLVGNAIKLHPHGSGSIYSTIIGMANPTCNLKLFDTKGNWGGYGFGAAADRYTECKLSKIARYMYCQFIDYAPMQEGEIPGTIEPTYLPCLIPYGLLDGSSGMGIGLSSNIVPLNILDLIDYYLYYISNNEFNNSMIIRPEFGSSIIWMSDEECIENVQKYSGTFKLSSAINQESDTVFVIESTFGKNIDKVLAKLNKYIASDKVDFRNETKTAQRYVFEIMDYTVDPAKFKKDLQDATWKKSTFKRAFDVSGKSVFCTLNYVIKKQMKALNEAIDKKISTEISYHERQRLILEGLVFFKNNGIFDKIGSKTIDDLISNMLSYKKYSEEICREIVKKPISYLTRSHDEELERVKDSIKELENHNRREYLIELYSKLREMIEEYMNNQDRHFSILESHILSNPKAKLVWENNEQKIQITDKGRGGIKFDKFLYLIGETGTVYKRAVSAMSKQLVNINLDEQIVSIVSDMDSYICMNVSDGYGIVFGSSNYKYDKKWANLSDDQKITKVISYSEDNVPDNVKNAVRSKICKPFYY